MSEDDGQERTPYATRIQTGALKYIHEPSQQFYKKFGHLTDHNLKFGNTPDRKELSVLQFSEQLVVKYSTIGSRHNDTVHTMTDQIHGFALSHAIPNQSLNGFAMKEANTMTINNNQRMTQGSGDRKGFGRWVSDKIHRR